VTPRRIRQLRTAGVLDGDEADAARIVLLDMVENARLIAAFLGCSLDEGLRDEIGFALDPVMRHTPKGQAMRWAAAQARRRKRATDGRGVSARTEA
jgi:hypothetical protein